MCDNALWPYLECFSWRLFLDRTQGQYIKCVLILTPEDDFIKNVHQIKIFPFWKICLIKFHFRWETSWIISVDIFLWVEHCRICCKNSYKSVEHDSRGKELKFRPSQIQNFPFTIEWMPTFTIFVLVMIPNGLDFSKFQLLSPSTIIINPVMLCV